MRTIKSILTATFIFVVTIAVGFVSFYNIASSTQAIEAEASLGLENIAVVNALKIEANLRAVESKIDDLKSYVETEVELDKVLHAENEVYLESFMDSLEPYFRKLSMSMDNNLLTYIMVSHDVTDRVHTLVLEENTDGTYSDLGDIVSYNELTTRTDNMVWYYGPYDAKEGVWTGPYVDPFVNKTLVTYSVPVIVEGVLIAVIGADIDFALLQQIVEEVEVYETGYAFLVNDDYRFIVHPTIETTETVVSFRQGSYEYFIPILESNRSGSIKYHFDVDKIMGYARLHNDWILAVAPPLEEVHADVNRMKRQMIGIALISLVVAIVLAEKISIVISEPLIKLTQYVEQLDATSQTLKLPEGLKTNMTEIGYLGQVIEEMNEELYQAYKEKEAQNKALDELVYKRTEELLKSNEELIATVETLEETQSKLVKAEKHAALRLLIQNLAHRLNTPLGNTITTSSYLREMSESKTASNEVIRINYKDYTGGLDIIINAQKQMSEIVDSLSFLLVPYDEGIQSKFNMKKLIEKSLTTFEMTHSQNRIHAQIQCDESFEVTSYYELLNSLLNYLLLHSNNIRQVNESYDLKLKVESLNSGWRMYYLDPLIYKLEGSLEVFDPFSTAGFNETDTGIELFIVYDIVTRGLGGIVEQIEGGFMITVN